MKYLALFSILLFSFTAFAAMNDSNNRASQVSFVRGSTDLEVKEISSVQCRADVAGNLGGKYFLIYSALDAVKYGIWYDVDDGSSAPTVAGATLVEVDISSGDLGDPVCAATETAMDAVTGTPWDIGRVTDTLTITSSDFGAVTDIADVDTTHTDISKTTDGVSAEAAIGASDIIANIRGFQVCNDAVNTSTYLLIGWSATVQDTGIRIGKGICYSCEECSRSILSNMYVSGQADANAYGIVQWRK